MPGFGLPIYKIRMANRSASRGRRWRISRHICIFGTSESILLSIVYSKSDRNDVSRGDVRRMLRDIV